MCYNQYNCSHSKLYTILDFIIFVFSNTLNKVMTTGEILSELTNKELLQFVELYNQHLPYAIYIKLLILNQLKWNTNHKYTLQGRFNNRFYTNKSNKDFFFTGTIISITEESDYIVTIFSLEENLNNLYDCLDKTNLIKWNAGPLFAGLHVNHKEIIYKIIQKKNLQVKFENFCGYYYLNTDSAKHLFNFVRIPDEIILDKLKSDDALLINTLWPHRYNNSELFIETLINYNGGFGIYCKKTGKLLSWILKNEFFGIGILQTLETEQRKGFGKLLIKILIHDLIMNDKLDYVISFTLNNNKISQKIHFGLGFTLGGHTNWLQIQSN